MAENPEMKSPLKREYASAAEAVADILRIFDTHEKFLLCGHVRPDGDCIGSVAAVYHFLKDRGKEVRIYFRPPVLEAFENIAPGMEKAEREFPTDYEADVTVCLDCSTAYRAIADFQPHGLIVNIDHHTGNGLFGDVNWVDPQYAAVGEMVFQLIEAASGWTPVIASCVYLAVVTDTGAFRYSNTRVETFRMAARLMEEGADPSGIAGKVWGNRKVETCLIAAAVWNNIHFELDKKMVWSEITQSLFAENGGEKNEPDNLVSELIGVNGALVAVLLRETSEGGARVSFRSRPPIDVNVIASLMGGGGHRHAAGLEIKGKYEEVRLKVIETTLREVQKQLKD